MNISLSAFVPENLVSRDGFGSPVLRQPAHLHTQAESGATYLRDSSRVPRRHHTRSIIINNINSYTTAVIDIIVRKHESAPYLTQ